MIVQSHYTGSDSPLYRFIFHVRLIFFLYEKENFTSVVNTGTHQLYLRGVDSQDQPFFPKYLNNM